MRAFAACDGSSVRTTLLVLQAFRECPRLREVVVHAHGAEAAAAAAADGAPPQSLSIGDGAFHDCGSLAAITLEPGLCEGGSCRHCGLSIWRFC